MVRKLFLCLLILLLIMNSPAFARANDQEQDIKTQGRVHRDRQVNQEDTREKDRQLREQRDKDKHMQEDAERQRKLEEQRGHDKQRQEREQEDRRLREQREHDKQVHAEQEQERRMHAQRERERQLHEQEERARLERERREAIERERRHQEQEERERRQQERYWRDGHYDWSHHEAYQHKNWNWIERPFERRLPFAWHDSLTEHTLHHYLEALEDSEWYDRFPGLYPYRWHDQHGKGFWYRDRYVSDAILFYNEDRQLVSVGFMRDGVFIMMRDDDHDYENRDFFFFSWWDQNIKIKIKL